MSKPQSKPEPRPLPEIKEMPSRDLLAEFLASLGGAVTVIFDQDKGKFERVKAGDSRE